MNHDNVLRMAPLHITNYPLWNHFLILYMLVQLLPNILLCHILGRTSPEVFSIVHLA